MSTVLFTDGLLASSITSAQGVLQEYVVPAESRQVLAALHKRGTRLGLVVLTRDQPPEILEKALAGSGLLKYFDPRLVIYGDALDKHVLSDAFHKTRETNERTYFVGQHSDERTRALEAGFDAAIPHPLLVSEVLNGERLVYARVSGIRSKLGERKKTELLKLPFVPFHVSQKDQCLYVVTTKRVVQALRASGYEVTDFGPEYDPQTTDPYFTHDGRKYSKESDSVAGARGFLEQEGKARFIVSFVDHAILLALPSSVSIEKIHFPHAFHCNNRRLLLNTCLLSLLLENKTQKTTQAAESLALKALLTAAEVTALKNGIDANIIEKLHAPYAGDVTLDGTKIMSRHVLHDHNSLVTKALIKQLTEIGKGVMVPHLVGFDYPGKPLGNVVADLPGKETNSFVIVSAHLDSTAAKSNDYEPLVHPAPGADDDASGIAAVLAIATVAVKLHLETGPLQKSLRFILFNAEEDYVIGSQKYVRTHLCGTAVKVHAVFQMDMIGYTGGSLQKEFEVHVGCLQNPQAEHDSLVLAKTIESVRTQIPTVLNSPQVYGQYIGNDFLDPLDEHSDHFPFLVCGYRACVVTEDSSYGPMYASPAPRPNGDYHKTTDKTIDYAYAAEIARVVGAAAIQMAKE